MIVKCKYCKKLKWKSDIFEMESGGRVCVKCVVEILANTTSRLLETKMEEIKKAKSMMEETVKLNETAVELLTKGRDILIDMDKKATKETQ